MSKVWLVTGSASDLDRTSSARRLGRGDACRDAERWREVSVSTDADTFRSMSALQF